jgi:hypothetical protein
MSSFIQLSGKFLGKRVKEVGEKKTKICNFWLDITDNPQFPNTPEFQIMGEKISLLDNIVANDNIQIRFNLRGTKIQNSEGKSYIINNLNVYSIAKISIEVKKVEATTGTDLDSDDLPF